MASFDEAKETLKQFYIDQGFKLVDEGPHQLRFASGKSDTVRFSIEKDEIDEYEQVADTLCTVRMAPVETSIVGTNYREQLL